MPIWTPSRSRRRFPGRQAGPTDFNAYLRIGADGRVTCFVGKVELGQGAMTALAQLLAEELDVPYDSVDMVMGDTDLCPYDMGTFGSMCVRMFGPVLRAAGAEARAVLLQMAAEQLQAPAERLQVKAGVITDPLAPDKRVTYAQLVQGKRIERHIENVPLKPVAAFTVIGKSPRRKDALEKVTGKAKYAGDFALPGMLHARILRPPAHGATLKDVDTSAAEKVPGARVVRDGDLIAVLHERPDLADQALGLIKAQFDRPHTGLDDKTIFDHLLKTAPQPQVVGEGGSIAEGEKLAAAIVDETYLNSYVAHAPMETHSAIASIENGKATVWASTQAPFSVKPQVAQALGFPQENVRIITPYVGGGFGGKSGAPQAVEAARLAKAAGKPVQVVWDRAEEFFFDTFRPAAVVKIRSGLTAAGKIAFWDAKVYARRRGRGAALLRHPATIARSRPAAGMGGNPPGMHPFGVGAWRAPSANTNTFARESHIDILAAKAGVDPLEFRLSHLTDPRMRRALETVGQTVCLEARRRRPADAASASPAAFIPTSTSPPWRRWPSTRAPAACRSSAWSRRSTRASSSIPMACASRWKAASPWAWATRSPRRCASRTARCSTATSTPTRSRVSHGCPRSRPSSSTTPACPRRDAANRPSSPWARWSPTPSTTP